MHSPIRRGRRRLFALGAAGLHVPQPQDEVLPIDKCSRRIAPRMQKDGYDVRSIEFAGPHTVPQGLFEKPPGWGARGPQAPSRSPFQTGSQDIRQQAVEWLIGG